MSNIRKQRRKPDEPIEAPEEAEDEVDLRKSKVEAKEIAKLVKEYETFDHLTVKTFKDIPLSSYTHKGLAAAKYTVPTEIQKESIAYALKGQDVLGAAKTGSGKTLAFIIPVLECLYRERWTRLDGVGALVITPTRELAYQIFEVVNKIGFLHDFSVGLIIGGKDLKFERGRMDKCNIVICTPGRILQHMDENPVFNCDNLKMLILDEADRILDLGFAKTMNAIIEYLPQTRQTLLFSATQTKSVKDLARLSLKDPIYVSVHENASVTTPEALLQSYIVCELHDKLNILYSFIKNHRKCKILVFMATCKQVKYVYELFCRMRPGISLLCLYGTLHQQRRMAIYDDFRRKEKAVLFATDIASRGLDFPAVNWVVQLDCPEDVNTYIHRAGRTARYKDGGEALLFLVPSEEESMLEQLEKRKIPISKIEVDPKKVMSIHRKAEAFCARDVSLKESAQRAFKSYVKNCLMMKDKSVFNLEKLDLDKFSKSLGLEVSPRLRFMEKARSTRRSQEVQQKKLPQKKEMSLEESINFRDNSDDEDDDLFTVKRIHDVEDASDDKEEGHTDMSKKDKMTTKAAVVKKLLKKKIVPNKKIVFDANGNPVEDFPQAQVSEKAKLLDQQSGGGINIELAKEIMKEEDKVDKKLYRELIKAKHREKRKKLKEQRRKDGPSKEVILGKQRPEDEMNDEEEEGEEQEDEDEEEEEGLTSAYIDELPDPDRFYDKSDQSDGDSGGEEGSNGEEEESGESSAEEEEDESDSGDSEDQSTSHQAKRRKLRDPYENNSIDTRFTLDNDEALAMHLLRS